MNKLLSMLVICLLIPLIPSVSLAQGNGDSTVLSLNLDKAIEMAVANNSLIKEAIEKQKAAMEEEKSAKSDLYPKAMASYSYTNLKEQPYSRFSLVGPPTEIPMSSRDNFHWDISIVQPVFTGFALSTRHQMAKLGVDIREMEKKWVTLDIIKQVKLAYLNILLAKKIFAVAEDAVKHLELHAKDAEKFYEQGIIPLNDLLKSKVALAHAVQNRVRAESNIEIAVASLNTLLRVGINRETEVEDILKFVPSSYNLDDLITEAVHKRPELEALHLALKNADQAIRLVRSSYYPQVALVGNYSQTGDNPAATDNDYTNSYNASATVQAKWTFFEWGKTKADIKRYMYEKFSLEEKLKGAEDGISLEVKNAFLNLQVSQKNIKTAEESLAQARENFRITNLQYQQQMTTSTEVLDARTYLTQAETNYYSALYGYMISEAELMRAIGKR